MRYHSIYTFVALLVIILAACAALRVAERSYRTMLGQTRGAGASPLRGEKMGILMRNDAQTSLRPRDPLSRGVIIGYWKMRLRAEEIRSRNSMSQNEKKAAELVRRYIRAQQYYFSRYGKYAPDASALIVTRNGEQQIIDDELTRLIAARDRESAVQGYYFSERTFSRRDERDSFLVSAMPAEYGVSGRYTLFADQTGDIKRVDNRGAGLIKTLIINDRVVSYMDPE